jgi:hypothetical protein
MQLIPAQFGKSWQIGCRQLSGNPFASAIAGSECWQSTAIKLPAIFGNLWRCVFFADLHYTFCRQNGVCPSWHNLEAGGKVVGKRLAILFCTGIAGKVPAKLHP